MSYKVIEKNEFGVLVIDNDRNQNINDVCSKCKYLDNCNDEWMECIINTYYLPDSEVVKLEAELTPATFTINDMYVEAKLLFDCQDRLEDFQIENKQLKEKIEELQAKDNELIKFLEENIKDCEENENAFKKVGSYLLSESFLSMRSAYKNILEFIKNQK